MRWNPNSINKWNSGTLQYAKQYKLPRMVVVDLQQQILSIMPIHKKSPTKKLKLSFDINSKSLRGKNPNPKEWDDKSNVGH